MGDSFLPGHLARLISFFDNRAVIAGFYPGTLADKYGDSVGMRVLRRFAAVHHNYANDPYAIILKCSRKLLGGYDGQVEIRRLRKATRRLLPVRARSFS